MPISERTKQQALKVLDGIETITRNNMLEFGFYLSPHIENKTLAQEKSVCGGHTACLIGSAYLAGGVKIEIGGEGESRFLPGIMTGAREEFLRNRHGLRTAIEALDAAAVPIIESMKISKIRRNHMLEWGKFAIAEGLFESAASPYYSETQGVRVERQVLRLVTDARKVVEEWANG